MPRQAYKKLSITLPAELFERLRALAEHDYLSLSASIQRAVAAYVDDRGDLPPLPLRSVEEPKSPDPETASEEQDLTPKAIEQARCEFPFVSGEDVELLQFLAYYESEEANN